MPGSTDARTDYVDRIDINDPADVRRWAVRFNVPEHELRRVVALTGIMLDDIREQLENAPPYFFSATKTPSQSALGGSTRKFSIRSR